MLCRLLTDVQNLRAAAIRSRTEYIEQQRGMEKFTLSLVSSASSGGAAGANVSRNMDTEVPTRGAAVQGLANLGEAGDGNVCPACVEDKDLISFGCNHGMCGVCFARMILASSRGRISCPLCRRFVVTI